MDMTPAGLDVLPTADGWVILEVNPVAGFFDIFGDATRQENFTATYDWITAHT